MGNKYITRKRLNKRNLKRLKRESMAKCKSIVAAKAGLAVRESVSLDNNSQQNDSIDRFDPDPFTFAILNNAVNVNDNIEPQGTNDEESIAPEQLTFANLTNVGDDDIAETQNTNNQELVAPEFNIAEYTPGNKVTKNNKKCEKNEEEELAETYDGKERLIIDKDYFFENLKKISSHGPQFGCTLSNLNITGETKKGLNSKLKFTCDMCRAEFFLNTTNPLPTENLNIDAAAVSGITNTGIGLEQFTGLFAAMNLPILSRKVFTTIHNEICEQWEKTAHEAMAAAAAREKEAAIEEGRVKDGVPVIDVIADGCWSKRSYKKNYSALSGAAAIIGRKFGEVLFLGVKNKYCCICARAQNKGTTPKEHTCFKNYTGASSGMEAAIIAEGFKNSLDMYGIIYGRVIADGDSNTYNKILEERPYVDVTVEKIECRNHVLRNMCNKLAAVSTDTKYPLNMRKMLTTQRILAMRKVIISAIKKHKDEVADLGTRINYLYKDISNSYHHAFGHHSDCLDHYCSSEKKSEDLVPKIRNSLFWARIQYIVGIVATHSRSLVHDYDSNAVEQFNSIIAKFVAGKRTNLIQRQTYQSRCAAAVVAYNTKRPLYNLQKSLLGKSPKSKLKSFENKRIDKNIRKRQLRPPKKINFNTKPRHVSEDKHYGTDTCQKPDMPEDIYNLRKTSFLNNLHKTDTERATIEKATILQRNSSEWLELRRNMLTASNFGKVIKRRATTSASIVKALLYKSNISHVAAIKHGIDNEPIALKQLAEQENVTIRPCGLFIDGSLPFLAATPDGLIGDNTIVEIKCPLSSFKMPIKEAVAKRKIKFWDIKNDQMVINKNDAWYFQIQGQLHVTKKKMCLFAVWSGENQMMVTENILRDDEFWDKKMVGKLEEFYMNHILPELIDPRLTRNMKLRQPSDPKQNQPSVPSEPQDSPNLVSLSPSDPPRPYSSDPTDRSNMSQNVLPISKY